MGRLVDGKWQDVWYDTGASGGRFVRKPTSFRDWITADGSSGFPAKAGRYHLYVSYACPWAHRALIFRQLKGLESAIGVSVVDPRMGEQGWPFGDYPGTVPDPVGNACHLHQVYTAAKASYTGRVTVPVLWDCERRTIVNNESSEIIRMFNSAFGAHCATDAHDYYPERLRSEIDSINDVVYSRVNNGVYRAGFATTQEAYEEAYEELFETLDMLEERLSGQRYLVGAYLTEADWRLFTTLVRFDAVYYAHFKCNRQRLSDYPHLWGLTRELYQVPGVAETVNFDHIKTHYFWSHTTINPTRVVPRGPELDFLAPHGRD